MIESLLSFVTNEFLIQIVGVLVMLYLTIVWMLFPVWVFIDAQKKFKNFWVAFLLFLFILPLNVLGLIFYLVVRPEDSVSTFGENDNLNKSPISNVPFKLNILGVKDDKEGVSISLVLSFDKNLGEFEDKKVDNISSENAPTVDKEVNSLINNEPNGEKLNKSDNKINKNISNKPLSFRKRKRK